MNWQQIISLAIVALAAGLLTWGIFRRRKFSLTRDTHCGCAAHAGEAAQKTSIVFHARKRSAGPERAVVVKIR